MNFDLDPPFYIEKVISNLANILMNGLTSGLWKRYGVSFSFTEGQSYDLNLFDLGDKAGYNHDMMHYVEWVASFLSDLYTED